MPENKNISNIIKRIIQDQRIKQDPVGNLFGNAVVGEEEFQSTVFGSIQYFYYNSLESLSPFEILSNISSFDVVNAPILGVVNGHAEYPTRRGTNLFITVIDLPQAGGVPITIEAPGQEIAFYINESITRRSSGALNITVNLPGGKATIIIVTKASTPSRIGFYFPKDLAMSAELLAPKVPVWYDTQPLEAGYVDPKTGTSGIRLRWYNQPLVGGWNIYRVNETPVGTVISASENLGRLQLRVDLNSGITAPGPSTLISVGGATIGQIESSISFIGNIYSGSNTHAHLQLSPIHTRVTYSGSKNVSGPAATITYNQIGKVVKTGSDLVQSFVDTNIKFGEGYNYALDSYSIYSESIRSAKTRTVGIVAGDTIPPASVSITGINILNGVAHISYTTPPDEDYYATKVNFYYQGSGTGSIYDAEILTDFGLPDTTDSLSFDLITSGTYYLVTVDQVGNQQFVLSGESFYWNGDESVPGQTFLPPQIIVRQWTSDQLIASGLASNLYARYEIDGVDRNNPGSKSALTIYVLSGSGGWGSHTGDAEIPFYASLYKRTKDNWIRVYGEVTTPGGLVRSDEYVFESDFDVNPEISSIYHRVAENEDLIYVSGSVDDDAQSLKWYISSGASGADPTPGSPAEIFGLSIVKSFSFTFQLDDGERKELTVEPYAGTGQPDFGALGLVYKTSISRLPRTLVSIEERTTDGQVTKSTILANLTPVPIYAETYYRVKGIDFGQAESATASTLVDNDKAWTIDQYNDFYEAEILVGSGRGQTRGITDTSASALTISPNWSNIPNSTSEYRINELTFRRFNETGTVTGITSDDLTDSTKTWIPNQFSSRKVRISEGPGVGQVRDILSNTSTVLSISPSWNVTPVVGVSVYEIIGPVIINRDTDNDRTLEFYSFLPGIGKEETRSVIIDNDTIPSIGSGAVTQPELGLLQVTISEIDEDVKFWRLYGRKASWPTINSGSASAALNPDYIRFFGSTDTTSIQFNVATQGDPWWYFIVIPMDSFNSFGGRLLLSGQVQDVTIDISLSNVSVEPHDSVAKFNRIRWNHNSVAENNSDITVDLYAFRSDLGKPSLTLLTPPNRRVDFDSEAGDSFSTGDDSNIISSYGSFLHEVDRRMEGDPQGQWLTWNYKLQIFDTGVLKAIYTTSHSDWYGPVIA